MSNKECPISKEALRLFNHVEICALKYNEPQALDLFGHWTFLVGHWKLKRLPDCSGSLFCDHDWSRTSTSVRTLPPQSSTSTNSATWPVVLQKRRCFSSKAAAKIEPFLKNKSTTQFFQPKISFTRSKKLLSSFVGVG